MSELPPNERQFSVDFEFKPNEPGTRLHPGEMQLLLAHIGEILQEIEVEERNIIEEERKAAQEITTRNSKKEVNPCK